jgi:hypothetical protein
MRSCKGGGGGGLGVDIYVSESVVESAAEDPALGDRAPLFEEGSVQGDASALGDSAPGIVSVLEAGGVPV